MKKINEEIEKNIIEMYQNGISMMRIGKCLNLSSSNVYYVLKKNKIKTRTKGGIEPLDDEKVISQYKSGMPSTKIAELNKVSVHTITNILEKHNISRSNIYHNLNLIEDYWENIDTKDKAYFLGFLISDGNVIGNTVRLSLNEKDIDILKIFKSVTKNENKLYEDKRGCVSFGVKRKKWVDDLSKYGVVPNKTLIVKIPYIKEELMHHLLRGLIDGDGWVTKRGKIGFCGNKETVTQVHDFFVTKLQVYDVAVIRYKNSDLYAIQWSSKKDFKKICDYLYFDKEDFYLKRKYENFLMATHGNTEVISEIAKGSETP